MSINVSIIIPCKDAVSFIQQAVESSLGQSLSSLEVIVIDDGSEDGTADILDGYKDRILRLATDKKGANYARNVGLKAASGTWVKFLDADDYLLPGAIKAQVAHADTLKEHEFSVGDAFSFGEVSREVTRYPRWDSSEIDKGFLAACFRKPPNTSCPLYRRSRLVQMGGWNTDALARQEVDLIFRYMLAGNNPVHFGFPIYVWRNHDLGVRVSKQINARVFESDLQIMEMAVKGLLQQEYKAFSTEVREALAKFVWLSGRHMLRYGYGDIAEKMFSLAKVCNSNSYIHGRNLYRQIAQFFGPNFAEGASLFFASSVATVRRLRKS